jgi:hypothetical protein
MVTFKTAGLGDNFYYGGYDLSGDVASVDTLSGPSDVLEVTAVKQFGHQRLYGQRAGTWSFTTYFESATGVSSPGVPGSGTPVVSTYSFPVLVTVIGGTGTQVSINGVNQGTFDGTYLLPAFGTIILTYSVAPTWSWTVVGTEHQALSPLTRLDQVATYFRGTAIGNSAACMVAKQLDYDPTRDTSGNLSLKVDLQANSFGMEWGTMLTAGLRTDVTTTTGAFFDSGAGSFTFGGQAYLQLVDFVGTSVDVSITHSATSGGTYTTLADFGSQTAIGGFRVPVTGTVNEFWKVVTAGTFTYATFAVVFNKNPVAVSF